MSDETKKNTDKMEESTLIRRHFRTIHLMLNIQNTIFTTSMGIVLMYHERKFSNLCFVLAKGTAFTDQNMMSLLRKQTKAHKGA